MEGGTHIELFRVSASDRLALIDELVEEQEPPKTVLPNETGEAEEGERGEAAERELNDAVVGPGVFAVAGGAGQQEMGDQGHNDREQHEHEPGETRRPRVRLVHAHPP
jgi:hypothetical protein